jgi:glycosyltransferase involved in cell wall biosynthesis
MKKKILIYSDCFTYSGSENVIENILASEKIKEDFNLKFCYAKNRGYGIRFWQRIDGGIASKDVTALRILNKGSFMNYFRKRDNPVLLRYFSLGKALFIAFLEFIFIAHLYNILRLCARFAGEKIDLLYINNGGYPGATSCRLAVIAASLAGVKKIVFNVNNMAFPAKGIFDDLLDSFVKTHVTYFITASKAAQARLIDVRSFPPAKFVTVPNTLMEDKISIECPAGFTIQGNKLKIGAVGLLTFRKGYHDLLAAVRIILDKGNDNFEVYIIGDGEERFNLENQIAELNIEKHIKLLGYKNRPMDYLSKLDLFVLPSVSNEDFPYVILEAMFLSKPVIGTNVAGIPEQIESGVNGFVVPPANPQELAEAIIKFITTPDLVRQMGLKSHERYFKHFNYSRIEKSYYSLFSHLVN